MASLSLAMVQRPEYVLTTPYVMKAQRGAFSTTDEHRGFSGWEVAQFKGMGRKGI
jgi:hypothetical protein